jgi:cell division protein FtsN
MTARDYKRSRPYQQPFSGWTGLALGLAAGLALGLAVWYFDRRGAPATAAPEEAPPPMSTRGSEAPPEAAERYDFYDMLPKFEVVVPEKEKPVRADAPPAAVDKPGPYVLQAGSYRDFAEADRIRAQLALQGIESRVQKVSVDADTWHRVRIGPISDPAELERIRQRLREADIDVLVIRVPE